MERATELEYLRWFRMNVDLGPAGSDVEDALDQQFMRQTGKALPEGWNYNSAGEEI